MKFFRINKYIAFSILIGVGLLRIMDHMPYDFSGDLEVRHHQKAGTRLMKKEKYREAITEFAEALELDKNSSKSHFLIGSCYESLEQLRSALLHYDKSIELDPGNKETAYRKGRVLANLGQYRRARNLLETSGTKESRSEYFYLLGLCNAQLGREIEAAANLHRAESLGDSNSRVKKALEQHNLK